MTKWPMTISLMVVTRCATSEHYSIPKNRIFKETRIEFINSELDYIHKNRIFEETINTTDDYHHLTVNAMFTTKNGIQLF